MKQNLLKLIYKILLLILITLFGAIVCFSTSSTVIFLLKEYGVEKQTALILGCLVACVTQLFIWNFYKIKNLIINN